ncbi:MAG: hypothetical protein JJW00_08055 [Sulfurimonas sp.]|nr:hypothetical protein [Sulfurimonas sp.]
MKKIILLLVLFSQVFISTIEAEDFKILDAKEQEEAWDFAAGLRVSYLKLGGGFTAYDAKHDTNYKLDYDAIGMDNYAASNSLAFSGEWKNWNLFFSASKGVYKGSFQAKQDIFIKDNIIPKGDVVNGKIEMGIYSISGTYDIYENPTTDVALGFGALVLDFSTEFVGETDKVGADSTIPMPYLALSGRKDIAKYRFIGVGGGAYYDGKQDDMDYTVYFITLDARAGYEFYNDGAYKSTFYIGYKYLYMDSKTSQDDGSWYKETDTYSGPFINLAVKYTMFK